MLSRTVFITGGSRGIGAALAIELTATGHIVIAPPRAELDLADLTSLHSYLAALRGQKIDILINNAGINILKNLNELDEETWSRMLQVNLSSALRLIQEFAPGMQERGWGRILNISTIFSQVTKERRAAYSMTKAALNALTRSAAVEYGRSGILVNSLAPGYIDTALTRQNNTQEDINQIISTIPLRRMANVSELAKIASFLVSDQNTYITGQMIAVDGGYTCL
jgi:3-oxoacyl-[acyl-carrier protein] reductase